MMDAKAGELWLPLPADEEEAERFYRAIKTAMLLADWTDELAEEKICERYAVGPGDVFGMVENINWLLHATSQLARMFAPVFYPQIADYEICMKNGIRRELLPLIRSGIGRVRAAPVLQQWRYVAGRDFPAQKRGTGKDTWRRHCGSGS